MGGPFIPGVRALESPVAASVVTVGTFDGVHLGHQTLVQRAVERARALGAPAVVYTFHPHPAKILAPERAPPVLQSIPERARLLRSYGADLVVVEPFDKAFSSVSADEWVTDWLGLLRPKHVVIGFNFSYGRGRGGGPEHMVRMGERLGFTVDVVGAVEERGTVVSSTLLRALIEAGDVSAAARLLGRPFALSGRVVPGDGRGRTIGVPTANLEPEAEIQPALGVYATMLALEDGSRHRAVTNIGVAPTFGGTPKPRVETHVLGFDRDLYGQAIRVELIERLREERRFPSKDALIAQIQADIQAASELLRG